MREPLTDELERLMRRCIELARDAASSGNYALGALVARSGEVIAESGSSLIGNDNDPSAHPEMIVVRRAAEKLESRYLTDAVLVTTLEPCPMCTSVAIWAKMAAVAFGATQQDAEQWSSQNPDDVYTWRQIRIPAATVVQAGNPPVELVPEVMREECRSLFHLNKPA